MKIGSIVESWDRFFFSRVSPYPVAAFRILQGMMYLQFALSLAPDLLVWFGVHGIVREETLFTDGINKLNVLSFFPTSDTWVYAVWIGLIASAFCMMIGFQTRMASVIIFLVLATYANRDGYLFNAGDTFLRSSAFWLVFAPSNEVWSVDSWLKNSKNRKIGYAYDPLISAWAWRALQIQMCLVYYSAFFAKTHGWFWSVGEAVYIAARFESLARFPMPFSFDDVLISQFFSYGTLAVEFALFTLIWVKELRYYVIACGLCLHLTIDWVMSIPMFEWMMIVAFVLFVEPEDLVKAGDIIKCTARKLLGIKRDEPVQV